ncbi:aminotransferase class I/II-fold pyridoxal phosphate-dependent enzyme [Jeotgalibacillus marinus]|uniref:Aminotransferase class I/II-fold pyridoxal phosphate-dependent enzyme n=1 Tax=Jeotgalibacillus marinus TaxID=86667 RepID=A0ABV3Q7I9_9BACL
MDQSRMPLVEALNKFKKQDPVSYHVPGHKNGLLDQSGFFGEMGSLDVTELIGLDDLHAPAGVIKDAMNLLRKHYQSQKSYFLINGSTVGNLTMILATCDPGNTVLVASNSHKSIINACSFSNVRPIFLEPFINKGSQTPQGISVAVLKEAIQRYPEAKAIILTYPSYYGHACDIQTLIEKAQQSGLLVLIDEAHGAHLTLGPPFAESTLTMGADIVVHSAHKTLPALTMGSYLHIGTERVNKRKVERVLGMLQSSSPSYPIMASLDAARSYLATMTKQDIQYFLNYRKQLIRELSQSQEVIVIEADDPLKLILKINNFSGYELQRRLEQRRIYVELADPLQVLLILPLLKEGVLTSVDRIVQVVREIASEERTTEQEPIISPQLAVQDSIKELAMPLQEVDNAPSEWIDIKETTGKIAAASVIPYPPGIPFVISGERITGEKVFQLSKWIEKGLHFQGDQLIHEGKIKVVRTMEESNE